MEGQRHHHHHQMQQQMISVNVDSGDRFPQWSILETNDFLAIRAELDQTFMETKRNKLLWEVIANKMKEKGYIRSPEQCKCKWKNLVTRYKGCETVESEAVRQQFPFYNELQAIFAGRMQRMLWAEAEGAGTNTGFKRKAALHSSDEEEDNEESEGEKGGTKKKKRLANKTTSSMGTGSSNNKSDISNLREILDGFIKQQVQMEMQWREAFEARENERMMKEIEWRQNMEAIENERLMMERSWREREEQRRVREEARAEKRDALITVLLNKFRRDEM